MSPRAQAPGEAAEPDQAPPAAPRRLALEAAGAALCLAAAVAFAASVWSQRLAGRPRPADAWTRGTVITPAASQPGVVQLPGPSRVLIVDSTPDGAEVRLGGQLLGETPLSQDWGCTPGEVVQLELRRGGFRPSRYALTCAEGTTRVQAPLKGR